MKTTSNTTKSRINKNAIINFRVTDAQKQNVELKASEMGLSLSAYFSHLVSDYDNLKKKSQELGRQSIESMTQKEIIEKSLLEAKKDSEMLANPAFTEFYESLNGKVVDGKLIKSKADLLGVMASRANVSVVDGKHSMEIPLTASPAPVEITTSKNKATWLIATIAVLVCAVLAIIYFSRKTKDRN